MGVSTSPSDLAQVGSNTSRSWNGTSGAAIVGATVATALLIAMAAGSVPLPAGLPIVLLVPAALVDIRERRLPDVWVGTAAIAFIVCSMIQWVIRETPPAGDAALGVLVVGGPILALHLVSPAAMGFGDVKAAAVIGLAVGSIDWRLAMVAVALAAGAASVIGVLARLRTLPFGPFLVLGASVATLGADWWLDGIGR